MRAEAKRIEMADMAARKHVATGPAPRSRPWCRTRRVMKEIPRKTRWTIQ